MKLRFLLAFLPCIGCSTTIDLAVKARDVQENLTYSDDLDWTGGTIKIQNEGTRVSINGGVRVIADGNATRVSATARLVALVLPEEKSNGDLTLNDVQDTFRITRSGDDIVVTCGHGKTHGSSLAADSGCELITVTIPAGNATTPLDLTVVSGSGGMSLELAGATMKKLVTSADVGNTNAQLPATAGGDYTLVSEEAGDLDVAMPAGWSADVVKLEADADAITSAFPLTATGGYGAAGGLASLTITSREFAGSTGNIDLH